MGIFILFLNCDSCFSALSLTLPDRLHGGHSNLAIIFCNSKLGAWDLSLTVSYYGKLGQLNKSWIFSINISDRLTCHFFRKTYCEFLTTVTFFKFWISGNWSGKNCHMLAKYRSLNVSVLSVLWSLTSLALVQVLPLCWAFFRK